MITNLFIIFCALLSGVLFIVKFTFKIEIDNTCQYIEFIVDVLNIILAYQIWQKVKLLHSRIFIYLPLVFIAIFLVDAIYYILYYLIVPTPNTTLFTLSDIINNIILVTWFILTIIFAIRVINRYIIHHWSEWLIFIAVFGVIDTIILKFFAFSYPNFNTIISKVAIFWITHYISELVAFNLFIIILIHTKTTRLLWLVTGFAVGMASQFLFTSLYVYHQVNILGYAEWIWLTSLLLVSGSMAKIIQSKKHKVSTWFCRTNSLNSRLIFCIFVIAILSFMVSSLVLTPNIAINSIIFIYFPIIAMIYSLLVALIAVRIGIINLESPIKQLKLNINLMHKNNNATIINSRFKILEFNELQKFINKSLQYKQQRDQLQADLVQIATGVAHDIKSPLMIINIKLTQIVNHDKPDYKIIKNALRSIQNIAENMLTIYNDYHKNVQLTSLEDLTKSYVLVSDLLDEIYCQKQAEWEAIDNSSHLELNLMNNELLWLNITSFEFKRHISNLLNNSFEAKGNCHLNCSLNLELINSGIIKVSIVDNGKGVDPKLINQIISGRSPKESGHGLGLSRAKKFFEKNFAKFEFVSDINHGATINVYFPVIATPKWFTLSINIKGKLVVIDNELSVLDYWRERLGSLNIQIFTFSSSGDFFNWFRSKTPSDYSYFVDYSLNNRVTGLEVIKKINQIKQCYLITNNYSDHNIQESIGENYLIPKSCLNKLVIKKAV